MKITFDARRLEYCQNRLRNKTKDDFFFLSNYLIIYIERKIAEKFDTDSIIDEVYDRKECRASIKV